MAERLYASLPADLLDQFQIILSRVRELKPDKFRILWCHDLPSDKESHHLADGGWKKFHRLVFVSYWQRQAYIDTYDIPPSKCVVLTNAIYPITGERSKSDKIRLIYHTTPHRGLNLLASAVNELAKEFPNIELNVYSSFSIYGWESRDEQFKPLFDFIRNHPNMNYYGAVPNDEIRKELLNNDVYAYPCIWPETSCISLIEAMSAGLVCVHPDLTVLPETSASMNFMYPFHEDQTAHLNLFYGMLRQTIQGLNNDDEYVRARADMARDYAHAFYDWNVRAQQWKSLLEGLLNEPRELEQETFVYRTG